MRPGIRGFKKRTSRWPYYILVIVIMIVILFPIFWQVLSSLKSASEVYEYPPTFYVKTFENNYAKVWVNANVPLYFFNSIFIGLASTALSLSTGTLAAYALSRLRVRGSGTIAFSLLLTRMVPPVALIFPLYLLFLSLKLMDTYQGMTIAHTTFSLPFAVWMMRSYFQEVPMEMEESAMVDGCTRLGALIHVILPLAKPGLVATAIFNLILSWNDLLFALVLTQQVAPTMPILLTGLASAAEYGEQFGVLNAIGTIIVLPILIFAFIIQKHLIRGLTWGAVKG